MSHESTSRGADLKAYYMETENQLDQIWAELLRLRDTLRERRKKIEPRPDETGLLCAGQLVPLELRIVQIEDRVKLLKTRCRQHTVLGDKNAGVFERHTIDNKLEKLIMRWGSLAYLVYILDRFQERIHTMEDKLTEIKGSLARTEQEEQEDHEGQEVRL